MTLEEIKAKELIEKFSKIKMSPSIARQKERVKQCAIICVDEMIKEHAFKYPIKWNIDRISFWTKVKEILTTK